IRELSVRENQPDQSLSLAVSHNGRWVLFGSRDHAILRDTWERQSSRKYSFERECAHLGALDLSADGRSVLIAETGDGVALWSTETHTVLRHFPGSPPVC